MTDDQRFALLVECCQVSGFSLDELEVLTRGLDAHAIRKVCGNVSALPRKRKSNEVP